MCQSKASFMQTTDTEIILSDNTPHTGGPYPIGFDQCSTAEDILSFVQHLSQKQWVTSQQIDYFVEQATSHHKIVLPKQ